MSNPNAHRHPVGTFLMIIGAITPNQVNSVLQKQQEGDKRLFGEIAIELNYFDDYAIKRYIDYIEHVNQAEKEPPCGGRREFETPQ